MNREQREAHNKNRPDRRMRPWLLFTFTLISASVFVAYYLSTPDRRSWFRKYNASSTEIQQQQQLAEKLSTPIPLSISNDTNTVLPHQFLHLHHMKTGGTSMDGLIRCAMERIKKEEKVIIPYYNIHECGEQQYQRCVSDKDSACRQGVKQAALMSYCAPLKDLENVFEWHYSSSVEHPIHALTVFRNPMERVWSMFRFQTKRCYQCRNLTDIYAEMDNGTSQLTGTCQSQLLNHQTRNVLSTALKNNNETNDVQVQQAIDNMKSFFTLIGLTEELETTAQMVGMVFPWLNETVKGSSNKCTLPHKNASPQNNRCGPHGSHWDLPNHPDKETARIILQHNQKDMQLYQAAVQHFRLQKIALGLEQ